jgi:hypothetical protein
MKKHTSRLFIDPASISTGWALFSGDKLVFHGTIVRTEGDALDRLASISKAYEALSAMYLPDEIIIERMNHIVAYQVVWSVGVIAVATRQGSPRAKFAQLSPQTWQKYLRELGYARPDFAKLHSCESEDEATAIAMGLAFTGSLENKNGE